MNFVYKAVIFLSFLLLQACANNSPDKATLNAETVKQDARVLTAEGQAVITRGQMLLARRKAVESAIKHAALQAGHKTTTNLLIGSTKVVDEWREGNVYHVQVLALLSEAPFCKAPYKKRIVATAFPAVTSGQISGNESQDLYSGIPREITNLLMESGDFTGYNKTNIVLYSRPGVAPEIISESDYGSSSIIDIAREAGAQFVLSGVIRDFAFESTEYVRGAGILAQIKAAARDVIARRGVTLDVYIHDGFSGALLFQHRYSDSILGDVWIPSGYSVGSERFNATPAGNKMNTIIHLVSQDIRRVFGCYPFSARVVKVENDHIVIAAGSQDKLKRGDKLVVYTASAETQELGLTGTNKEPVGMLEIDNVNVMFSTGTLDAPSSIRKVRVGDWVKNW